MHLSSICLLGLALPTSRALADVLVVDAGGGGDFLALQVAIDAAQDGDVLLVRGGVYAEFTLDAKTLDVFADSGAQVDVVGRSIVRNVAADATLVLSGLDFSGVLPWWPALTIEDCAGPVRLHDCELQGTDGANSTTCSTNERGSRALEVAACTDVALEACALRGGDGGDDLMVADNCYYAGAPSGAGLHVQDSAVTLYRTLVYAGAAGDGALGGWPAAGAEFLGSSELFAFQSLFEGGAGGSGDDWIGQPCAAGAPGLFLSAGSVGWELACLFSGGAGGQSLISIFDDCIDGPPTGGQGVLIALSGSPRSLVTERVVREGQAFDLSVFGQPGDVVQLFWSAGTEQRFSPFVRGAWLLDGSAFTTLQPAGTIGAPGFLVVPRTQGQLPLGLQGLRLFVQPLLTDTLGRRSLGNPVAVLALDDAL